MNLFILSSKMKLTNLPLFIHLHCGRVEAVSQIAFLCTILFHLGCKSWQHSKWRWTVLKTLGLQFVWKTTHRDVLALMCCLQWTRLLNSTDEHKILSVWSSRTVSHHHSMDHFPIIILRYWWISFEAGCEIFQTHLKYEDIQFTLPLRLESQSNCFDGPFLYICSNQT